MPDKMARASLQQLAVSAGIAIDKMLLLRAQATSSGGQELTNEERIARLRELFRVARARRLAAEAGGAGPGDREDG
jgi:hypothetical protein